MFFLLWTPNKEDRGFLLWELEKLNVLFVSENSGVPGTVGVDVMKVTLFGVNFYTILSVHVYHV